jgi:hypothetical protein
MSPANNIKKIATENQKYKNIYRKQKNISIICNHMSCPMQPRSRRDQEGESLFTDMSMSDS